MNEPTAMGFAGFAPSVVIRPIARTEPPVAETNPEAEKYRKMWARHEYRHVAPGEHWAMTFLQQAQPNANAEVIDFGAGTGRGALQLALFGCMRVTMVDFAENCLDEDVAAACVTQSERINFRVADLTKPLQINAAYGFCTDVMEHVEPTDVPTVLRNILASAQHCFFAISTVPDNMGALIGEPLHLTVQPMAWWLEQLRALGAVIFWTEERPDCCAIYCSAWRSASETVKGGKVNVPLDVVDAQVKENILSGFEQVTPHKRQERAVVMLAGGPSLPSELENIRRLREEGCALVTVNGAYQWAIDNGLQPSVQIVLDAREFNTRFVQTPHPTCRYLVASQCHPKMLEGLPKDRTMLWHSGLSDENEVLAKETYGYFFPVPGGSTVILRAIPLMRILGVAHFHIFGFDSCLLDGAHHAYSQPENDSEPVIPVVVGGRAFECTPWQISQAQEFMDLIGFLGDEVELAVYGKGLIKHIIETGASIAALQTEEGN